MPTALIIAARRHPAGIRAALRSVCSAWPVPRPEPVALLVALGLTGLLAGAPLRAQACREPHYRWTQKTDTALADLAPQATSVSAILATWAPPHLGPRDRCALRSGRELGVYNVTGWVRRGDKFKDDGDWAVQLTERAARPSDSCILGGSPAPKNTPPA